MRVQTRLYSLLMNNALSFQLFRRGSLFNIQLSIFSLVYFSLPSRWWCSCFSTQCSSKIALGHVRNIRMTGLRPVEIGTANNYHPRNSVASCHPSAPFHASVSSRSDLRRWPGTSRLSAFTRTRSDILPSGLKSCGGRLQFSEIGGMKSAFTSVSRYIFPVIRFTTDTHSIDANIIREN